ncbi:DUF1214 domain-containing protein [Pseudohalioglobus sediminis]|uniref:DUF1214 domain-containing protein n=1 Tax=Pseudohalioglobus sediminis TaxID=2606449 RepID=A0A5B0WR28_9GAMM|nr:DUF1214 domain-containing protein [Pseudohalioglobus sediminis]KAA1189482.1 DUF1214 domain-containing protein [Pseudohalioglobus sediminis]
MKKLLLTALLLPGLAFAEDITIQNLMRAESDTMFRLSMKQNNIGIGELFHEREVASANAPQTVIRPNQDTLYSAAIADLSKPVTVTLPQGDKRFQSVLVISQDHYNFAYASPGSYELTEDEVGTRFAMLLFRTFVDAGDPDDAARAHAVQDGIVVEGGGKGPFEAPDWDLETLAAARKAVNDLAAAVGLESSTSFGRRGEIDPLGHLIGMAGWAGQPARMAEGIVDSVDLNDGETPHVVKVRDVPVDAFWSITVYDADGFLAPNELNRNSYNNTSATPNDDGSFTIHFGACEDGRINCIPITAEWSYTIRLYQPREEILDGSWTFPAIVPAD